MPQQARTGALRHYAAACFSIFATRAGKYGFPLGPIMPFSAIAPAISRRLRFSPVLGLRRAKRRASATTSAGTGLRPSHRPVSARFRSWAPRSLATRDAFSNHPLNIGSITVLESKCHPMEACCYPPCRAVPMSAFFPLSFLFIAFIAISRRLFSWPEDLIGWLLFTLAPYFFVWVLRS